MASLNTKRSIPQKTLPEGLVAIPAAPTDVVAKYAVIFQITVSNPSASGVTLIVADKQTVPLQLINITVAANSLDIIPFPEGVAMKNGINWQAGGTGLVGEIFGFSE